MPNSHSWDSQCVNCLHACFLSAPGPQGLLSLVFKLHLLADFTITLLLSLTVPTNSGSILNLASSQN